MDLRWICGGALFIDGEGLYDRHDNKVARNAAFSHIEISAISIYCV